MVKALSDISGHFDVLDLIPADGHFVGVKYQDVCGHQNRIGKESHGDAKVGIIARRLVGLHCRLVGVRAIHQPLGRGAGQYPAELRDLGNIRLAIKMRLLWIQPQR